MGLDSAAANHAFQGAAHEKAEELLAFVRNEIPGRWTLVSSRTKLHKTLFEAEWNDRRVIGKVSGSSRAVTAFGSLNLLWSSGLRPPSRHTVVEPIAWFPARELLIQERAPGSSLLEAIRGGPRKLASAPLEAARWLKALWQSGIDTEVEAFDVADAQSRYEALAAALRDPSVVALSQRAIERVAAQGSTPVPSHGDFHPMNLYVAPDRVTAIDMDTFALREKEVDVAYFLAQTANLDLQATGSYAATEEVRRSFLAECGDVDLPRVAAYMGWTLLKSLHYDFCILRVRNAYAGKMLEAAARLIDTGRTDLQA